jgi:hypothetical protein
MRQLGNKFVCTYILSPLVYWNALFFLGKKAQSKNAAAANAAKVVFLNL